ncbi:hypothetical protein [Rhizobium etli]|uniref:hypothetical protein n=1 Tax=Rhizobium etli TaxID=29449 RepID=UPI001FCFBF82|nr:hypothetical protein [Rhizobium etli]
MAGIDDFLHRILTVVLGGGWPGDHQRGEDEGRKQPAEANESVRKSRAHDVIRSSFGWSGHPLASIAAFCADDLNNRFTKYGVIMALNTIANFAQF